ncbi:hypothetical protein MNBD_GAMMA26-538 [hydrothermal vent metagenome]|uniref:PPM-type phosphatase domain-containing protein n=1 Tax=hydrothermal vent metagenome TaxID=652676 RepID=A0A3B1BPS2_9ZZZZ
MRDICYEIAKASLVGNRTINQDRCTQVEAVNSVLLCLADGMGGHPKGEVAAQILTDTCEQMFQAAHKPVPDPSAFLVDILRKAHGRIVIFGKKQSPHIKPRTTAAIVLIQDSTAYWVHAGDSRLYLFRNSAIFTRTTDHSYVELLRQQGAISARACATHPHRNYVTRCLGGGDRPVDFSCGEPVPLRPEDVILLCSDGLWGALDKETLTASLFASQSLSVSIKQMTMQAEATAAPDSDNVTAIAIRWIEGVPDQVLCPEPGKDASDDEEIILAQAIDDLRNTIKSFKP